MATAARARNSWGPIKPLLYLPLVERVEVMKGVAVVEVEGAEGLVVEVELCIYPWWR